MSRPELTGEASSYYNLKEARKYDSSSRMIGVQREITERAIELLKLPKGQPCFILDVGCGSGLSGRVLEEQGHVWVGCDISHDMLMVANERIQGGEKGNSEGSEKEAMIDDDDSFSEEDDEESISDKKQLRSVGDLMHHVRIHRWIRVLCLFIFSIPIFAMFPTPNSYSFTYYYRLDRIWGQVYHFVQQLLMHVRETICFAQTYIILSG